MDIFPLLGFFSLGQSIGKAKKNNGICISINSIHLALFLILYHFETLLDKSYLFFPATLNKSIQNNDTFNHSKDCIPRISHPISANIYHRCPLGTMSLLLLYCPLTNYLFDFSVIVFELTCFSLHPHYCCSTGIKSPLFFIRLNNSIVILTKHGQRELSCNKCP